MHNGVLKTEHASAHPRPTHLKNSPPPQKSIPELRTKLPTITYTLVTLTVRLSVAYARAAGKPSFPPNETKLRTRQLRIKRIQTCNIGAGGGDSTTSTRRGAEEKESSSSDPRAHSRSSSQAVNSILFKLVASLAIPSYIYLYIYIHIHAHPPSIFYIHNSTRRCRSRRLTAHLRIFG